MTTALQGPPRVPTRIWGAATAVAGTATLLRPQGVARLVLRSGPAPGAAVIRVLGARQLVQGAAVLLRPTELLVIGAVFVDVVHMTSMVAAALIWPGFRRAALVSAAVAGVSAAAGALIQHAIPRP